MKTRDIEPVLRLTGWCKNIDRRCARVHRHIFHPRIMKGLENAGLMRPYSEKYGWRLSGEGFAWLEAHGFPVRRDRHTQLPGRRFQNAAVAVTMYAAGIDPFTDALPALRQPDRYLPAFILRAQRGRQLPGSNQVVGFLRAGNRLLAAHYPEAHRLVVPERELQCTEAAALGSGCMETGFLFCGESYAAVWRALIADPVEGSGKKRTPYARLFERAGWAALLPCTPAGVLQLRVMQVPDYRTRLGTLLGGNAGELAAAGMPDCDFLDSVYRLPARIMVDMELTGVTRAARQARAAGYGGLVLAGFPQQKRFLARLYPPPFFCFAEISEQAVFLLEAGEAHAPV